jgi:hypothetical protein
MRPIALDDQAFQLTFVDPMRDVTADSQPIVDVWSYVRAIPASDLHAVTHRLGEVEHVYRSGDDRFDHVLIPTTAANVYLVVVVDRSSAVIYGHHVLDLNVTYGLKNQTEKLASSEALAICKAQNVVADPPLSSSTLGVALATLEYEPLNGLRSRPEGGTCGWYIWGGPDLPDNASFFQPMHVSHLSEHCPKVLPYLSLPPGWRFLLGADGHVDVWRDEHLLDG